MQIKNYWRFSEDTLDDLKYTDNIYEIMEEQCKYLFQYTKGMVFAVFGEIKFDGSFIAVAKAMSDIFRGVAGFTGLQETVAETSTKDLINADSMYYDKRYGFEICTEKYRFRLFELRMTPVYPVEIIIDEGICKNIGKILDRIAEKGEKPNIFIINDETIYCEVLQCILQDKKVRYIIGELQKRMQVVDTLPEKVIICEGRTDEIVLHAIARKLKKEVTIVVADGKYNVPGYFDCVKGKNTQSDILIVVDSDGDKEDTKRMLTEKIDAENYEVAIVDSCIEEWFLPEVADFSKLKLIQSIDAILEDIDFVELSKKQDSFAKVVEFLQR